MPKATQKPAETSASDPRIAAAEKCLGYEFEHKALLSQALCHASTRNEGLGNNERLEFLGDAVLNLLVSWFLHEGMTDADEGALSHRRSRMTQGETLAVVGAKLKLGELLRTGKGQDLEPTPNMEADAVEACIGAVFLDGGIDAAQQFVFTHIIAGYKTEDPVYNDPKSRLQHYTLAKRLGLPSYRLIETSGPGHQQEFRMEVLVDGAPMGEGTGTSKKLAQQHAAENALEQLDSAAAAALSKTASPEEGLPAEKSTNGTPTKKKKSVPKKKA